MAGRMFGGLARESNGAAGRGDVQLGFVVALRVEDCSVGRKHPRQIGRDRSEVRLQVHFVGLPL